MLSSPPEDNLDDLNDKHAQMSCVYQHLFLLCSNIHPRQLLRLKLLLLLLLCLLCGIQLHRLQVYHLCRLLELLLCDLRDRSRPRERNRRWGHRCGLKMSHRLRQIQILKLAQYLELQQVESPSQINHQQFQYVLNLYHTKPSLHNLWDVCLQYVVSHPKRGNIFQRNLYQQTKYIYSFQSEIKPNGNIHSHQDWDD